MGKDKQNVNVLEFWKIVKNKNSKPKKLPSNLTDLKGNRINTKNDKAYYKANPDKVKARKKAYREANQCTFDPAVDDIIWVWEEIK
jgi:hypothetical protein